MDGEVIDPLLGLLDEGVTEQLPGEILDAAVDFFQRLIDGNRADGNGGVAQDPLAGGVDVLACGEIHDGVRTPLGGPAHFFDFLVNGGCHGGVADVGIDFDQEVAPDDHGLELRVVDIGGNDGASTGNL